MDTSSRPDQSHLIPTPITIPAVANKPPIFIAENPLSTSPRPKNNTPARADRRVPSLRIMRAFRIPRKEIHAVARDPTNASVDDVDTPSFTSAACRIPQQ